MNKKFTREIPLIISFFLVVVITGFDIQRSNVEVEASEPVIIEVTPTPTSIPTPTPTPATEKEKIVSYIKEVFGEHSDKAFQVLQGKECAENRALDPNAVNDNRTWGGVGRDRGIFQINDKYHPLTDEQAFDYKQNIDYAYRMFVNDNYTFSKRWTCGKVYKKLGLGI